MIFDLTRTQPCATQGFDIVSVRLHFTIEGIKFAHKRSWTQAESCRVQWQMRMVSIVLWAITSLTLSPQEKSVLRISLFLFSLSVMIWAKLKCLVFLALCFSTLAPSTFNTTKEFWRLVSVPSEAGTETSITISRRGRPVTARKKCHHLCVNSSYVGGQDYWHLDDHPGPLSLAPIDCIQHILVGSRARLMSNLSSRENVFCLH